MIHRINGIPAAFAVINCIDVGFSVIVLMLLPFG